MMLPASLADFSARLAAASAFLFNERADAVAASSASIAWL
jgi:hypothetical protein